MSKWALVIQSTRGRGGRKTRAPLRNCSPTGALLIPLHFIPTGALRKKTYSRSHFHRYWNWGSGSLNNLDKIELLVPVVGPGYETRTCSKARALYPPPLPFSDSHMYLLYLSVCTLPALDICTLPFSTLEQRQGQPERVLETAGHLSPKA